MFCFLVKLLSRDDIGETCRISEETQLNSVFIIHIYMYVEVTQRAPADIPDRRWMERRPEGSGNQGSICPDSLERTKIKYPVLIRTP